MRRKLFCTVLLVITLLYLFDLAGISLRNTGPDELIDQRRMFTGKIVKIRSDEEEKHKLEIEIRTVNSYPVNFKENILITYYGKIKQPWEVYNEVISFTTELSKPSGRRNPYCFDYEKYLKSTGVSAVASIDIFSVEVTKLTLKDKYEKWLFRQRCLFEKELSEQSKGIIMGILFGDTGSIDEDVYEDFRNNGTAHVLAVSGLHVGIIYSTYKKIAGKRNSIAALLGLGIFLFSYGVLSMWSPSVVRATLMIIISIVSRLMDLRYDMLTAASTVAIILIAENPYVIFGAGFQMSFLAIVSLAFLRPVIPDKIPEFLATTLAVNLGLLVYQIYNFNYISLISITANLPVVFLTGYFVPLAIAGFVMFCITGTFNILKPVAEGMALLIMKINELSTLNGHGAIEVVRPPLWAALTAGVLLFFVASETFTVLKLRHQYRKITACIILIIFVSCTSSIWTYEKVSDADMVFVDVGQGDCIHVRKGSKDILIDGGGNINYNVGKNTLKPYLLRNGAADLDLAIVTHMHTDHYKGILELSEAFPIKKIMTSVTAGTIVEISDGITIESLWPQTIDPDIGQEENSQCSVFMVYFNGYKVLITGDLDADGEKKMIEKYRGTNKLSADILKIGHHGSRYSTCDEFLEAVNPTYAVIQSGKNNYGHPSPEVIEKCQKKGIMVLRNDYNGAVGFSFRKSRIYCHVMIDRKE